MPAPGELGKSFCIFYTFTKEKAAPQPEGLQAGKTITGLSK